MVYRLCSIDSSSKSTGITLFINGKYSSSKLIQCNEKDIIERMISMGEKIMTQLDDYYPDTIYIEEAAVIRNPETQRCLVRIQGIIISWCIQNHATFKFIRPAQWRALVGIKQGKKKRKELKEEAVNKVKTELNIETNDDVAESILIGIAASMLIDKEN